MVPPEERQLIDLYLQDDPAVVEQIGRWIAGAASPYRGELGADLEDALQQTHLKLFNSFQRNAFRGEAKLKTYVAIVASRTCLDLLRNKRERPVENLNDFPDLVAQTKSPEEELMWMEVCLRVLGEVSQKCLESLAMIVDGMSYKQMSDELGETPGTLRKRVHDCRKELVALRDRLFAWKKESRRNIRRAETPIL